MTEALAALITSTAKASPAVAAIAGSRVYPTAAPQGVVAPYCVWTEVSTVGAESHDNMLGQDETQVQFACYANDTRTALLLRSAIRSAFCAGGGYLAGATVTSPTLRLLPADEVSLANAILELTLIHNPTT